MMNDMLLYVYPYLLIILNINFVQKIIDFWLNHQTVAYLGFQKGVAKCSLATTQRGSQTKFSNFFAMSKKNFFGQRGGMADLAKG